MVRPTHLSRAGPRTEYQSSAMSANKAFKLPKACIGAHKSFARKIPKQKVLWRILLMHDLHCPPKSFLMKQIKD